MAPFPNVQAAAEGLTEHIKGKVVLITGGSVGGLGFEAARDIAKHSPCLLVLTFRTQSKADEAFAAIRNVAPHANLRSVLMEMADRDSIRAAAAEINALPGTIDVLIHNAGIASVPLTRTKYGTELTFETNHIASFLFTKLLLPKMLAAAKPPRIVVVSSAAHAWCKGFRWDDPNYLREDDYKGTEYFESKILNVLFAAALARRAGDKLEAISVTPGWIVTNITKHLTKEQLKAAGYLDAEGNPDPTNKSTRQEGCVSYIVAAFDPEIGKVANGGFLELFGRPAPEQVAGFAQGEENENKMWELSEATLGEKFDL